MSRDRLLKFLLKINLKSKNLQTHAGQRIKRLSGRLVQISGDRKLRLTYGFETLGAFSFNEFPDDNNNKERARHTGRHLFFLTLLFHSVARFTLQKAQQNKDLNNLVCIVLIVII